MPRKQKAPPSKRQAWIDSFSFFYKSASPIVWVIVLLLSLLEIKRYYNIDVIPGYDSSVDDIYGAARGTLSEWFGD